MLWPTPYLEQKQALETEYRSLHASPPRYHDFSWPEKRRLPSGESSRPPAAKNFTLYSGGDLGERAPLPVGSRAKVERVKVRQDEEQHWKIGDTTFYDYEGVTYRVDPKTPRARELRRRRQRRDHSKRRSNNQDHY